MKLTRFGKGLVFTCVLLVLGCTGIVGTLVGFKTFLFILLVAVVCGIVMTALQVGGIYLLGHIDSPQILREEDPLTERPSQITLTITTNNHRAWGIHGGELEFVSVEEFENGEVHLLFTDHDVQVCEDAPEGRYYRMICQKSLYE